MNRVHKLSSLASLVLLLSFLFVTFIILFFILSWICFFLLNTIEEHILIICLYNKKIYLY